MKIIGLTGAPGCGKSAALQFFISFGWKTVDADRLCHELHDTPGNALHKAMRERWGERVLLPDGTSCRPEIGKIVFSDEKERAWLESILYPELQAEMRRRIQAMPENSSVMLDIPLLFEKGWRSSVDQVITVWCSRKTEMERLLARGWSREHALARIQAHLPSDKKLEMADYGIINNGTLEELENQCRVLHSRLF